MTTSQRVPRRALLRRVGPWMVLAALLTGCASPAAQTALRTLEDGCLGAEQASSTTCETLALVAMASTTGVDGGTGASTASILTSATGGGDVVATERSTDEPGDTAAKSSAKTTKRTATPKAEASTKRRTQTTRQRTTRVPNVRMPAIRAGYFGGGVTVARFKVTGDTRSQILRSIRTRGPHGGASGVTQPYLAYRFTFKYDRKGRCRVVKTASTAVTMSFRITLPTWAATEGTDRATASWWAGELKETAAHERNHVRLWRNAVRQANRVVATSSCQNVGRRLDAIWRKATTANCRFDASEYGISLRACLRR